MLSSDSMIGQHCRLDTVGLLGGNWGFLDSTLIAYDFVVADNGDLVFTKFVNNTMELYATDFSGQLLWTESPPGQNFPATGLLDMHLFKGMNDDYYVSVVKDTVGTTYKYANGTWEVLGDHTPNIQFLTNGDPVKLVIDSDMTTGAQHILYTFESFDGNAWQFLDSVSFYNEYIFQSEFCVNNKDSIYLGHSIPSGFFPGPLRVFNITSSTAVPIMSEINGLGLVDFKLTSDLLGDIHLFYHQCDLGWNNYDHIAYDAITYDVFGTGNLFNGQPNEGLRPFSTCIDELNCVGFSFGYHTDYFLLNGPDSLRVDALKFCSCKYINQQNLITLNGGVFQSNITDHATYQWLDCANNFAPLPGETNASFTPTANGGYALEVSVNGCVDTTSCQEISGIGISEFLGNNPVQIYPNPATDLLNIQFQTPEPTTILLFDMLGKLVLKQDETTSKIVVDLSKMSPGLYTLQIQSSESMRSFHVSKN